MGSVRQLRMSSFRKREVLLERFTICGPVSMSRACGMLPIYFGVLFAQLLSDRNRFLPMRAFHMWLQERPTSVPTYAGKPRPLIRASSKQLVPQLACTQQAIDSMTGVESCLRLPTCPLSLNPNQ